MRNKTSFWKRSLAALLSFAMLLGMVPALGGRVAVEAEAAPVDSNGNAIDDYITLPITIRDFAADGMLFEYNEVDSSDTITIGGAGATGFSVYLNPTDWAENDYYGFRVYDYGEITFDTTNDGLNWHCVICDTSGNVVEVLEVGEEKQTTYDSTMQDGYFSVWVWQGDHTNYATLAAITDTNKSIYAIDYNSTAAKWYIGYQYNENAWGDNYTGINYFAAGQTPFTDYDALWADCLICDSNGNVIQTIAAGTDKQTAFNALTSGFALFATANDTVAQGIIRTIAGNNPTAYQATFVTDNYYGTDLLFLGSTEGSMTIHQNDTKGFGLMLTGSNDKIQDLTTTSGPGTYVGNGTYGSSTAPDDLEITLNSGAKQILHGATIRYNLVEANLVNGKPAYTEDTVTYLANYMSQIMLEPWQNDDGSYNSFFVMGTKMFDDFGTYVGPDDPTATLDLAAMLRLFVTDGLGDYDTTMARAASLTDVSKCKTWFDAAYYLLHYTWRDDPREGTMNGGTDGYGKYVPEYDSLHLVAKTDDDGNTYYVFNSGYNDTAYNPTTKEIFNTQTENITAAQDSSGDFYTRGIKLPAARFDPLGYSGTSSTGTAQWLGYGLNAGGNTYGDLVGASDTQLWDEYYDTTNYHLSLEGHAEFVYHYDSNLYFTFTGDDDVYLYINGVRVLDLGAAHSIVEATININDVAELCGLEEGGAYRFDFFYLERHGTAANFGIQTNIQLAESGMVTTKEGYQNGATTGYNGWVDPTKVVSYSFTLKNTGDATLEHLTFTDEKLGISLSENKIDLGTKLETNTLANKYVYIYDENNKIVNFYSASTDPVLNDETLMGLLEDGLPKGYSMTLYNFRYLISDADWEAGGNTFTNTVNTTGIANGKQLHGTADWKVQKANLPFTPFHVYNWVNKDLKDTEWNPRGVEVTKEELLQYFVAGGKIDAAKATELANDSSVTVVRCLASGVEEDYLQDDSVSVDAETGNITYTSTVPGMHTVFYKIKGTKIEGATTYDDYVFNYDVFTYGVADNAYVLDYGLNVELNEEFGFRENDHLVVPQNIYEKNITRTMDITSVHNQWGNFTGVGENLPIDNSVEYQPTDIIDGCDSMTATIHIREAGNFAEGTPLKFYGVDMVETVTTAPANVVYYEENHPGITYVSEGENQWVHYETVDEEGNSLAGEYQSADQNSNYGSDPNYEEDVTGMWDGDIVNTTNMTLDAPASSLQNAQNAFADYLNKYMGVSGQASNGTVNVLEIKQTSDVMYFDFAGTGFEIISRTTQQKYAVILVMVDRIDTTTDADGNTVTTYTRVRQQPVICESEGGDLYQVPVISITGLDHAQYRVTIRAAAAAGVDPRILYIDGVRIYGPLEDEALEYYNPEEYSAVFYEVKGLIVDPINPDDPEEDWNYYATYSDIICDDDGELLVMGGTTFIEYTGEDGWLVTEAETPEDYLNLGPNNELYFEGDTATSVLSFLLKPIENYPESARTIEIGAHRKIDAAHYSSTGYATLVYGSDAVAIWEEGYYDENDEFVALNNSYSVYSGTEQYYTIDASKLQQHEDGSIIVMIGTNSNENGAEILALTNLKLAGYTILPLPTDEEPEGTENNGEENGEENGESGSTFALRKSPLMQPLVDLYDLWKADAEAENKTPINENLFINSASFKAASVARGKNASLTVKATAEADTIEIVAPDGTVLAVSKCTRSVSGSVVTFILQWKVMDARGSILNYTIRVYDADGNLSANTQTVTLKVK